MVKGIPKKSLHLTIIVEKEKGLYYAKIINKQTKRSRGDVSIKENKQKLTIQINASDATALRASANSILRDLQVIEATNIKP
jgi:tRNA threonylcarbamoyladenosine modification (KEOPS) complex  Pcc1 subunit